MKIHAGRGRTISDVIDYVENPEKTRNGELITSYECDSRTADMEFELSKREYMNNTSRWQGSKDVIAYHIRQSFVPGEIDAETANRIGYELAMKYTKGNHAFVVCTHIDTKHIHNHIIFNSTALDCRHKFRDFLGSAFAIRRISDYLCVENGLSIIENPKRGKGKHYGDWLGTDRPLSYQARLRDAIDAALAKKPPTYEAFLVLMRDAGYIIDTSHKHITFLAPGQKKPTRLNTLKGEYTQAAVRERIRSGGIRSSNGRGTQRETPSLLIDIQSKLQDGKVKGYAHWATVFNLKQAAKTLIYLQEHGINVYVALREKTSAVKDRYHSLSKEIKEMESELKTNAELQKQIISFAKTRQVYGDYKKSGYSKKFKAEHETDILLHQTSKKYFDAHGYGYGSEKKLPSVKSLREEYAGILSEKKTAYANYTQARAEMRELLLVQENVDRLLGTDERSSDHEMQR